MQKENLSRRQREILRYILTEVRKRGYPPSVREIGKAVGLSSSSTVHAHLSNLERKGYLKRGQALPRAIEILQTEQGGLVPDYKNLVSVPLVGRIAAGEPLLAEENIDDYMPLPTDIVGDKTSFMLRVKGSSMINAGILDNDYVVVQKQPDIENGQIAAVLIEDEATIKRFYKERSQIRLQPENPDMQPIITKEAEVLGKVIAVLRRIT